MILKIELSKSELEEALKCASRIHALRLAEFRDLNILEAIMVNALMKYMGEKKP